MAIIRRQRQGRPRSTRSRSPGRLWGKAATVRSSPYPGLPEKGDVSDFFAAGGTVDELNRLIQEAPPWEPDEQTAPSSGEPSTSGDRAGPHGPTVETDDHPPGRFIKADDDPHRLTRLYIEKHFQHFDGTKIVATLVHHRDEFHRWDDSAYKVYRDVEVRPDRRHRGRVQPAEREAIDKAIKDLRPPEEGRPDDDKLPKAMKVTSGVVKNTRGSQIRDLRVMG